MKLNIRSSYDSFRDLRENNSYYIDKTEMLKEYLVDKFDKTVLFARPRRFGKTLTMTMFRDFLDIRQDSSKIFESLKIMEYPSVVDDYMNKYPVAFLSLKELFADDFEGVLKRLKMQLSILFNSYRFLLDDEKISIFNKKSFVEVCEEKCDQAHAENALDLLSRMLNEHYGKQAFIIIDEYDVPMAKALGKPWYDKVRDMVEHMLSYVCKTNSSVKAIMLSGCLYTVKNSTYTGVNNIIPYTILNNNYSSYIGFTDDDVRKLLSDAGCLDNYETVAEWYDGYIFGRSKMYCPWDVLRYVASLLDGSYNEIKGPESYWVGTSESSVEVIHGFLGKTPGIDENFEQLLAGKNIYSTVNDKLPYHKIHESGENIWSALVETGYLTKALTEDMPRMPLRIPNRSIREAFRQEVWNYFKDKVNNVYVDNLIESLWTGNIESAEENLNQILEATLSFYHEYHEYSYHLILDGFFTGLGYKVISELETGYGRSDLIILDPARNRCMILELKHAEKLDDIDKEIDNADKQLRDKKYESKMAYLGYTDRMQYGMAFFEKRAVIKKV